MLGIHEAKVIAELGKYAFDKYSAEHGNGKNAEIKRLQNFLFNIYDYFKDTKEGKILLTFILAKSAFNAAQPLFNEIKEMYKIKKDAELRKYEICKKYELKEKMETIHEIDHAEDANIIGFRPNKE